MIASPARLSGDDITNKLLALLSRIDGKIHKLVALTRHQLKLIAQIAICNINEHILTHAGGTAILRPLPSYKLMGQAL